MVVAAEQGLLDEQQVKKEAIRDLETLQIFAERHSRYREARYLVFFRTSLQGDLNDPKAGTVLENFLDCLPDEMYEVEKAMTYVDLARCNFRAATTESKTEAEGYCVKATQIFRKVQHRYGLLDIEEVICASSTESDQAVFERKNKLAEKYLAAHCYQNGIRVLINAIKPALSIQGLQEENQQSIDRLQGMVEAVEGALLKQVTYIHIVASSILRAPEYGRTLKSLENYWIRLPTGIGPVNKAILATLLSQIYSKLGNFTKAVELALIGFEIWGQTYCYSGKSDAAFLLALTYGDMSRLSGTGAPQELEWLHKALTLLEEWVDRDRDANYEDGEQQKCFRLAETEDYVAQNHKIAGASSRAAHWVSRGQTVNGAATPVPLLNYNVHTQVTRLLRDGSYEDALSASLRALELCQKTIPTPIFQLAQCFSRVAISRHMYFKSRLETATARPNDDWPSDVQNLFQALAMAFEAVKLYRRTKGAEVLVSGTNHLWLIVEDIALLSEEQAKDISRGLLCELEETETFCDSVRRSAAASADITSLLDKRTLVSNKEHIKLYSAGVQTCLRLGDASSAWLWVQKGKARALSDTFGFRALVPDSIMHLVEQDPELVDLYTAEKRASLNALYSAPEASIGAAREVDRLRTAMLQYPTLQKVIALREGAFDVGIEDEQYEKALAATGIAKENVKFVDWFIPRGRDDNQETLYLFVRQLSGPTHVRRLPLDAVTVKAWIRKTFLYPEGADPPLSKGNGNRLLSEMNGLVEGLSELSSPEDLLILSPTEFLNRIPLHGLKVGGLTLVERNLVTYSSSSAVLRHSIIRANSQPSTETNIRKESFFAVYEDDSDARSIERDEIYASVHQLASQSSAHVYTGINVTKNAFMQQIQESGWIHYHGHAFSPEEDILNSALILSNGSDAESHPNTEKSGGNLAVREIFDLLMAKNAPHINIIACDSGTQNIAPGNEPLGIVSAMLYAGATSVLGCLWPIESFAGRRFSNSFYSNRNAATTESSSRTIINIAQTLRLAVSELRNNPDTRQPYHWAPFVLHGSWFWAHRVDN